MYDLTIYLSFKSLLCHLDSPGSSVYNIKDSFMFQIRWLFPPYLFILPQITDSFQILNQHWDAYQSMYIFRILNITEPIFFFLCLPKYLTSEHLKINAGGKRLKGFLFYVCCSYVKNTYCDGFIQIGGSFPFYEFHVKEVPRIRKKQ